MSDSIVIYSREDWKATQIGQAFPLNGALGIVLHNMQNPNREPASDAGVEKELSFQKSRDCQYDQMHRPTNRFSDIGQNFTISRGGIIMEGRKGTLDAARKGLVSQGAHASGLAHFNQHFFGIELEGDFEDGFVATSVQKTALYDLCAYLRKWAANSNGSDWKVLPHADVLPGHTDCPRQLRNHMDEVLAAIDARFKQLSTGTINGATAAASNAPTLKSDLLQNSELFETIAEGHLVLQATGEKTQAIAPVQDALNRLGFAIDLGNNGQFRGFFGEKTEQALKQFQLKCGLNDVSGRVDQETILTLDKALPAAGTNAHSDNGPHEAVSLPRRLPAYATNKLTAAQGIPWQKAIARPEFNNYVGLMPDSLCVFQNLAHMSIQVRVSSAVIYECKFAIDSDGAPSAPDTSHQNQTSLRHLDNSSLNALVDLFAVLPMDRIQAEKEGLKKFAAVPDFGSLGLKLGDVGVAFWRDTADMVAFTYGDEGPPNAVGEGSIQMAKRLRIDSDPVSGGFNAKDVQQMNAGVIHIVFPGSTDIAATGIPRTGRTPEQIQTLAAALFNELRNQ